MLNLIIKKITQLTQLIERTNVYINFLRRRQNIQFPSIRSPIPNPQAPKHLSAQSFTLIELMVSMGILVIAITATMGIYINVIGTREKTLGQLDIQEDGQYLMSLLVKDVRAGMIDYDSYGGGDCGTIAIDGLIDKLCLLDFTPKEIRYKTTLSAGTCASGRCVIQRCEDSDCGEADYQSITMTNISVERLDFYINPVNNPFAAGSISYIHPRVTIVLKLKSLIEKTGNKEMVLQQTIPQRYTYRK